jgi:hypothetical protein
VAAVAARGVAAVAARGVAEPASVGAAGEAPRRKGCRYGRGHVTNGRLRKRETFSHERTDGRLAK